MTLDQQGDRGVGLSRAAWQFESASEMALAFNHRASSHRSLTRELKVLDRLLN
jgi:hypothetical protein